MSTDHSDLARQAMSLPISDRAILAQQLWESLAVPVVDDDNDETIAILDAKRRDVELDLDPSSARSDADVMNAASDSF